MRDVIHDAVVIGGGISGLTAAWRLQKAGCRVCLLEASDQVGGFARTRRGDGFLLEEGPFNVIVRDPAFEGLLDDFRDQVKVVTASRSARTRFIYRGGRLHAVPTNPAALLTTRLLSAGARRRLLSGLVWSPKAPSTEQTIEQAVVRRFGPEAADVIVSAAVSGIFAGDIRRLSLAACFPGIAKIDAETRSIAGYALSSLFRRNKAAAPRRWRGLVSFEGGIGALAEAVRKRLGANLKLNSPVDSIKSREGLYDVVYRDESGVERTIECQQVVIATPAAEAARLLEEEAPDACALLRTIHSASLAIVNLGFRAADVRHPLNGFGFLVPRTETGFPLLGVIFADSIFPQYAPPGHRLLRVFIGGAAHPEAVDRTDKELLDLSMQSLHDLLKLGGDPLLADIRRYRAAIPQYHLGHRKAVQTLYQILARRPGLHLVGNYLEGVSINDCVRNAASAAEKIIRQTCDDRGGEPSDAALRKPSLTEPAVVGQ